MSAGRTPSHWDHGVLRHGPCSMSYVRGREAGEAGVLGFAVLSICNGSFILQWRW